MVPTSRRRWSPPRAKRSSASPACRSKPAKARTVTFTVTTHQLSLVVGKDGKREVRPGNLQVQLGGSSVVGPGTLVQALTLEGQPFTPKYQFVTPVVN